MAGRCTRNKMKRCIVFISGNDIYICNVDALYSQCQYRSTSSHWPLYSHYRVTGRSGPPPESVSSKALYLDDELRESQVGMSGSLHGSADDTSRCIDVEVLGSNRKLVKCQRNSDI
jgi:hypothetical protein